MPTLDFMVLCDYVRSDAGIIHMIAAGIDRFRPPSVPYVHNVGVAVRIGLTREECAEPHQVDVMVKAPDAEKLIHIRGELRVEDPEGLTPDSPVFVALTPNFALPLQTYGLHTLELYIDNHHEKTVRFMVETPSEA
ncbi:DUF6941 family protein [Micromonospora aurantiaca (nom. illeg.)]|uniref:DUF6941 family protein n=1 Tax=Micromonospora aurantiaca (nom. illeg.) TaxID=47850 RepID=UPI0037995500